MLSKREQVVEHARSFLEVPWRHQGRSRNGIDCAGLVIVVAREMGLADYDTRDYQRHTVGHRFLSHFKANMDQKSPVNVQPGDVLLFRDNVFPCHSAITAGAPGDLSIVHAYAHARKVVEERLDQGEWMNKLTACFAFKGIDHVG